MSSRTRSTFSIVRSSGGPAIALALLLLLSDSAVAAAAVSPPSTNGDTVSRRTAARALRETHALRSGAAGVSDSATDSSTVPTNMLQSREASHNQPRPRHGAHQT